MILSIIVLAISLLLDGLLLNYLPYMFNDLSYFTPLCTLITLFFIYPLFSNNDKKYYMISFIFGFIYDLSYTNLLLWNGLLFLGIGYLIKKVYQLLPINFLNILLYLVIIILLYESGNIVLLFILQIVPVSLDSYIYKVTHSIIFNLIYGEILYIIFKKYHFKKR